MTDKLHTDLGTPEVHKRHAVMVEGGTMPRAKVMDQNLIDRYLMNGLLTLGEHQAGEYVLNQAMKAGIFTKPLKYDASGGGEVNPDSVASEALMRYGKTLNLVKNRYGPYAKYLVEEVVIHGWDISDNKDRLMTFKQSLEWIAERRMAGGRNPMRHIKKGAVDDAVR